MLLEDIAALNLEVGRIWHMLFRNTSGIITSVFQPSLFFIKKDAQIILP